MPDDFFSKRLASIEEEKARRLTVLEQDAAAQAKMERINRQIPLILDCVEKIGLAGLSECEIAGLFRLVADELEKIHSSDI